VPTLLQVTAQIYNPLAGIAQGLDEDERIGTVIRLQKIDFRGVFTTGNVNAANRGLPVWLYMWFLQVPNIRYNGASWVPVGAVDLTAIFDQPSATNEPVHLLRPNTKDGVKVLGRKRVFLQPQVYDPVIAATQPVGKPFVFTINMKNKKFEYESLGIKYQAKYNYYAVASTYTVGGTGPGANFAGIMDIDCRVFFKDA